MAARKTQTVDMTQGYYRRIYAGFIAGKRINTLSLEAEAWFWRVQATADDYGNLAADPTQVYLSTVGGRFDSITRSKVNEWVLEMIGAGLIEPYMVDGDEFLHIVGFVEKQPGGANGRRIHRVPACPNDHAEESETDPVNPGESKTNQNKPEQSSESGEQHKQQHKHEHKQQQQQESTPPGSAAAVLDSLIRAGISEPTRSELAAVTWITPRFIDDAAERARAAGKGAGALINDIRAKIESAAKKKTNGQKRAVVEAAKSQAEVAEKARFREEQLAIDRTIDGMPDDELHRLAAIVIEAMPEASRKLVNAADPRKNHLLRGAIYQKTLNGVCA